MNRKWFETQIANPFHNWKQIKSNPVFRNNFLEYYFCTHFWWKQELNKYCLDVLLLESNEIQTIRIGTQKSIGSYKECSSLHTRHIIIYKAWDSSQDWPQQSSGAIATNREFAKAFQIINVWKSQIHYDSWLTSSSFILIKNEYFK